MKKLIVVLATLGLMFNVIGCKAKKAQDDTEIVENADVEKIEAEDATFAGNESVSSGPVDESLQAALGEAPQVEGQTTTTTEVVTNSEGSTSTDISSTDLSVTPSVDETTVTSTTVETPAVQIDSGVIETPVVQNSSTETVITENSQVDSSLVANDNSSSSSTSIIETPVSETTTTSMITETPVESNSLAQATISETPVSETHVADTSTTITETPVEKVVHVAKHKVHKTHISKASSSSSVASTSSSGGAGSCRITKKIADITPKAFENGYINTVYIVRPNETLEDISKAIYGSDKSDDLKRINSYYKSHKPVAGDKICYMSPNRPTDSSRTLSFYEDTGMAAMTYVSEKGEKLSTISKKLLGYSDAWKEVWATNPVESKTKLAKGETFRYWKGVDQVPAVMANLDGQSKLIDSANQLPATPPPQQQVAQNDMPQQQLPPPPPAPEPQMQQPPVEAAPAQPAAELPPPPPPPPQHVAEAAPVEPKAAAPSMEEEGVEKGGLSSDLTMQLGAVAVLVALLGFVFIRRNKKKKESEYGSVEQTHVGT